jgi:hypothetical protein
MDKGLLKQLKEAFEKRDVSALKDLSNKCIENAALTEDEGMVNLSLISYALSKLLSKPHFLQDPGWRKFESDISKDLESLLRNGKKPRPSKVLRDVIDDISGMDASLGYYVRDVVEKARIKQASRIYAMGLSLSKAAELTKADKFMVYEYIGETKVHEGAFVSTKSILDRYKYARKVLK